jgi:hypothetical protein
MEKKRMSPQEKKSLSLKKDRVPRHTRNKKAGRVAVPRNKKLQNEAFRRKGKQSIQKNIELDPDEIENSVKAIKRGGWKKHPDVPLEAAIKAKKERRIEDIGAKIGRRLRTKEAREEIIHIMGELLKTKENRTLSDEDLYIKAIHNKLKFRK